MTENQNALGNNQFGAIPKGKNNLSQTQLQIQSQNLQRRLNVNTEVLKSSQIAFAGVGASSNNPLTGSG
jgi:hypothetical protein